MRQFVLSMFLFIGWAVPCQGGGLYLFEVNATEVGLAGAGWAARADDDVNRGPLSGRLSGEFKDTAIHFFAISFNRRF